MTTEQTAENGSGPTQSQLAFQKQTNALAHHLIGMLIVAGTPPVMAALASSQVVRAVIIDIARQDPEVARDLLEDMAGAIVDLGQKLQAHMDEQASKPQ